MQQFFAPDSVGISYDASHNFSRLLRGVPTDISFPRWRLCHLDQSVNNKTTFYALP